MKYYDNLITDFRNEKFQIAFKLYFDELEIVVKEWDKLFQQMNDEKNNLAYIRTDELGNIVGFIEFTVIPFSNWFFETKMGFIREFWIKKNFRSLGHGTELLKMAESYFLTQNIHKSILTTDSAEKFYIKNGYHKDCHIIAKNNDVVLIKALD